MILIDIFFIALYIVGGWFYCISCGYRFCEYFDHKYYQHLHIKYPHKFYSNHFDNIVYKVKPGLETDI